MGLGELSRAVGGTCTVSSDAWSHLLPIPPALTFLSTVSALHFRLCPGLISGDHESQSLGLGDCSASSVPPLSVSQAGFISDLSHVLKFVKPLVKLAMTLAPCKGSEL